MADLFVDKGEEKLVDLLDTQTFYLGLGTGTTAPAAGNTDLETPSAEARATTTDTQPTASSFKMAGTVTATGTRAWTEAGTFDAATSGNLWSRHTFSAVNVVTNDTLTVNVTWTVTGS